MEFRAVPNRVNQPPLQENFGENKIALASRSRDISETPENYPNERSKSAFP